MKTEITLYYSRPLPKWAVLGKMLKGFVLDDKGRKVTFDTAKVLHTHVYSGGTDPWKTVVVLDANLEPK